MLGLADLEQRFAKMHADGVDTSSPLLWGYFFVDSNPLRLKRLADHLTRENYSTVELRESEPKSLKPGEEPPYWLHVEKVETHTAHSLYARNVSLEALATRFGVQEYDGWDVGRPDRKPFARLKE